MADIFVNQLNGGKMSRKMKYRTEYPKRLSGVKELDNWQVMTQGGLVKRNGTRLVTFPEEGNGKLHRSFEFPAAGAASNSHIVNFYDEAVVVNNVDTGAEVFRYPYQFAKIPVDLVVLNDVCIFIYEDQDPWELRRDVDGFKYQQFNYMPPLGDDNYDEQLHAIIGFEPGIRRSDPPQMWEGEIFGKVTTESTKDFPMEARLVKGPATIKLSNGKYAAPLVLIFEHEANNSDTLTDYNQCMWSEGIHDNKLLPIQPGRFGAGTWLYVGGTEYYSKPRVVKLTGEFVAIPTVGYDYSTPDTAHNCRYGYICEGLIETNLDTKRVEYIGNTYKGYAIDGNWNNYPKFEVHQYELDANGNPVVLRATKDQVGVSYYKYNLISEALDGVEVVPWEEQVLPVNSVITSTPILPATNLPTGQNLAICDDSQDTVTKEQWGEGVTINKTVDIGTVLGEWEFRTNGNWNGYIDLQRNDGSGWRTFKRVDSNYDYNININDGDESEYNVQYRLVIDLVTKGGTQATPAQYMFSYNEAGVYHVVMNGKAKTPVKMMQHNRFSQPIRLAGSSVIFHQQRLWIASSSEIYASQINNMSNFSFFGTATPNKPIRYRLADTRTSPIQWLHVVSDQIMAGTTTGQWSLVSEDGTLSPETIRAVKKSSYPTTSEKPAETGVEFLYVDGSRKRIYASRYDLNFETYTSQDISVFNDEDLADQIKRLKWDGQNRLAYMLTDNGRIIMLNYDLQQQIFAFSEVKLNLDLFDGTNPQPVDICSMVDSAGISRVFITVTTDEDYTAILEIADVPGDGMINAQQLPQNVTLANARLTAESTVYRNNAGQWQLAYLNIRDEVTAGFSLIWPIRSYLETFPLEYGSGLDSTFGKRKSVDEVTLMLDDFVDLKLSWDKESSYQQIGEFNMISAAEYGATLFNNMPEPTSAEVNVFSRSGWYQGITMKLYDDSPSRTMLHAYIVQYQPTR